jgi:hypothetical protein
VLGCVDAVELLLLGLVLELSVSLEDGVEAVESVLAVEPVLPYVEPLWLVWPEVEP